MGTKIGVIESKWGNKFNGIRKNVTVKPLFDFFSDLHFGSHHAYEYEMVSTISGLESALNRFASSRAVTIVYLAMHGSKSGLHLHGGEEVTRTILKNRILTATAGRGSNLVGLYLGSCSFGTKALAEHLFKHNSSLRWIAGYSDTVDFVHSSGLDLLFFNTYLAVKAEHSNYSNPKNIREIARRLKVEIQGLCNTTLENGDASCGLGFSIFVRKPGKGFGVRDIARPF
jgi:hypothetical protein